MNRRVGRSSSKASGIRVYTLILAILFFVTAVLLMLFYEGRAPEFLQEKPAAKKIVFMLKEALRETEIAETLVEEEAEKLGYRFGFEDVTGQGTVRASNLKIGVDYYVTENSTFGVEASQGLHDSQDASAWDRSVDDETAAQAKYTLAF